eukprot:UC1_evm1s2041
MADSLSEDAKKQKALLLAEVKAARGMARAAKSEMIKLQKELRAFKREHDRSIRALNFQLASGMTSTTTTKTPTRTTTSSDQNVPLLLPTGALVSSPSTVTPPAPPPPAKTMNKESSIASAGVKGDSGESSSSNCGSSNSNNESSSSSTSTTARGGGGGERGAASTAAFVPIGYIRTCFPEKNGTPRQGIVVPEARGRLTVSAGFTNPEHSLQGLSEYSHVWVIFLFHLNANAALHAKVSPPRLEGQRVGLFATRSPHRPNPIGLSLVRLERVDGATVYLSGVDLVDGTPVLDIKPYIHSYDTSLPPTSQAKWLDAPPRPPLPFVMEPEAKKQLIACCLGGGGGGSGGSGGVTKDQMQAEHKQHLQQQQQQQQQQQLKEEGGEGSPLPLTPLSPLQHLANADAVIAVIRAVLRGDPRSSYRRTHAAQAPYTFAVDALEVSVQFETNEARVVAVRRRRTRSKRKRDA